MMDPIFIYVHIKIQVLLLQKQFDWILVQKDDFGNLLVAMLIILVVDIMLYFSLDAQPDAPWAWATKNVKKLRVKCVSHEEKLDLRFLYNKTEIFLVSITPFILRFAIVQNI